jgi:hypothetical protein
VLTFVVYDDGMAEDEDSPETMTEEERLEEQKKKYGGYTSRHAQLMATDPSYRQEALEADADAWEAIRDGQPYEWE